MDDDDATYFESLDEPSKYATVSKASASTQSSLPLDTIPFDQTRADTITKAILYDHAPTECKRTQDKSFVTKYQKKYSRKLLAALTETDNTEWSLLKVGIETDVATHINKSEQVDTLFNMALSKKVSPASIAKCPPRSQEFIQIMKPLYQHRIKRGEGQTVWKEIGTRCGLFVEDPEKMLASLQ